MTKLYEHYPELLPIRNDIAKAVDALISSFHLGGKLLICGNGGSASDSGHIVGELLKSFTEYRPLPKEIADKLDKEMATSLVRGLPVIDLTSNKALITAMANDVSADLIFAQQVMSYSEKCPNDVLLCISTSGNSSNVVKAAKVAKVLGMTVISMTGSKDSKLSEISNITLRAPATETYRIQEYHLPIYHHICMELEQRLF